MHHRFKGMNALLIMIEWPYYGIMLER